MELFRSIAATLTAAALAGGTAVLVGAAALSPPPADVAAPTAQLHAVPAGVTRLVCAPPPELQPGAVAYDENFNPIPVTATSSFLALTLPRADQAAEATLTFPGGPDIDLSGTEAFTAKGGPGQLGPDGAFIQAQPVAGTAAVVAGAGVWRSDKGDLRALVALPCTAASSEQWLVGGSTVVGSSARLVITNPAGTAATVSVTGWSGLGPIELPMLQELVVAPYSTSSYLLEGSTTMLERIALRVVATGGVVGASLLDSRLDGLTPFGVDVVAATARPATQLVIPGVLLPDTPSPGSPENPASAANLVRIANPGKEAALVTAAILTADGERPIPGAGDITIDPGAVFDISLAALPPGYHAVVVASDRPVFAAAQTALAPLPAEPTAPTDPTDPTDPTAPADPTAPTTPARPATPAGMDRAWVAATLPAPRMTLALPGLGREVGASEIVLANTTQADITATVTPYAADGRAGSPVQVVVPARGVNTLAVGELGNLVGVGVVAGGPLHAAAVLRATAAGVQLVSVLPALPDAAVAHELSVTLRAR